MLGGEKEMADEYVGQPSLLIFGCAKSFCRGRDHICTDFCGRLVNFGWVKAYAGQGAPADQ